MDRKIRQPEEEGQNKQIPRPQLMGLEPKSCLHLQDKFPEGAFLFMSSSALMKMLVLTDSKDDWRDQAAILIPVSFFQLALGF